LNIIRRAILPLVFLCLTLPAVAQAPLPRIVSKDGRHALIVDGAPFLMLGGQAHNSSNYPEMLPEVWPTIKAIHANTLAGSEVRVGFSEATPAPDGKGRFMVVEEGSFQNGRWVMKRRWNGDQADHGLNLKKPTLLKIRFGLTR
jgi:hypothetical protein